MAEPILGYSGTITATGTSVTWVGTWEANLEKEEKVIGPFIADGGAQYTYYSSKRLTGTIEGTIPKNKDAGQTALINAGINDTTVNLVLTTTLGYTITVVSGLIGSWNITQEAAETVTFSCDWASNGTFTVA